MKLASVISEVAPGSIVKVRAPVVVSKLIAGCVKGVTPSGSISSYEWTEQSVLVVLA